MRISGLFSNIRSTTRIAITLGCVSASVIWCALGLGIFPNLKKHETQKRVELTESIAISTASLLTVDESVAMEFFDSVLHRNDAIQSIAIRDIDGELLVVAGPHEQSWDLEPGAKSTENNMSIALSVEGASRGRFEIAFAPLRSSGWIPLYHVIAVLFCGSSASLLFWFYLSRVLKHLNPSRVVPNRVRNALDSLAEGLLILNSKEEIVLANQAFAGMAKSTSDLLQGRSASDFKWENSSLQSFPWSLCLKQSVPVRGEILALRSGTFTRKFIVNATPIFSEKGNCSGVLASFDDVTDLENKKQELGRMLKLLRVSRDEVQRQNRELQILASRDPLTDCLNRRTFFEGIKDVWDQQASESIGMLIVDIDYFKSINDRFGHLAGDQVIKGVGKLLQEIIGDKGLVCRYGGEEFCVLIMEGGIESTHALALEISETIRATSFNNIDITVSAGVSAREFGAMDAQHLLDQADQCLYQAKRFGRDKVVRFDECLEQNLNETDDSQAENQELEQNHYSAVTALLSALAFRDRATAEHCHRVASLAVALGEGLVPRELFDDLETAALLHDIGKIGVPDSILFKPAKLTAHEFKLMRKHEGMGEQIARSALTSPKVSDIIRLYKSRYKSGIKKVQSGELDIDVFKMAQIVKVSDAFDSMTSDRVYRKAISTEEAIQQLSENANREFDPFVVANLSKMLERLPDIQKSPKLICQDQRAVYLLGSQVERMNKAVYSGNIEELKRIVRQVEQQARDEHVEPIVTASVELSKSLEQTDTELEHLVQLTSDVVELCRATRSTLVELSPAKAAFGRFVNSLSQKESPS